MNHTSPASSFIYNVEILIESKHHAAALIQLLQQLNQCGFADYKIVSGIQLGKQVDAVKAQADVIQNVPIGPPKNQTKVKAAEPAVASTPAQPAENGFENLRKLLKSNKLIRLHVNKGLGIKASIPCRIINIEESSGIVTVYHVDEKQVYTFRLTEIEDYTEA